MAERVTVIGSFVVDLMARSPHIPVQGETVKGSIFKMGPGGKGSNQAVAAHRCGGDVILVTKVGNDVFGKVAKDFYADEQMDSRYVFEDPDLATGIALIMVDEHTSQNSITVVPGACGAISQEEIRSIDSILDDTSVLVAQLETNLDILPPAVERVHTSGGIALLNPAPAPVEPLDDEFIGMFDLVTPNETEASCLTGIDVVNRESAHKAALALQAKGVRDVIITMGKMGCFLLTAEQEALLFPTMEVKVVDTTGAGDAFNGGLATALSKGKDLRQAIYFATAVASLSVTKVGTAPAMPTNDEVQQFLSALDQKAYWEQVK
ncbi:ribokinase [Sphaerochaeta sp. S2]|uniref:ribokinase n=1 Tax=Sphaerochaeta sp. S2 TaxID=2798868 RepID=UPI0018E9EB6F|nr:ribokinase [Sphaerochaeta sp. S2]MBJ2355915.1 ribokinase [Sphaerochaeta sp. S2]